MAYGFNNDKTKEEVVPTAGGVTVTGDLKARTTDSMPSGGRVINCVVNTNSGASLDSNLASTTTLVFVRK